MANESVEQAAEKTYYGLTLSQHAERIASQFAEVDVEEAFGMLLACRQGAPDAPLPERELLAAESFVVGGAAATRASPILRRLPCVGVSSQCRPSWAL